MNSDLNYLLFVFRINETVNNNIQYVTPFFIEQALRLKENIHHINKIIYDDSIFLYRDDKLIYEIPKPTIKSYYSYVYSDILNMIKNNLIKEGKIKILYYNNSTFNIFHKVIKYINNQIDNMSKKV